MTKKKYKNERKYQQQQKKNFIYTIHSMDEQNIETTID